MRPIGKKGLFSFVLLLATCIATPIVLILLIHMGHGFKPYVFLQKYWWLFAIWRYALLGVMLWKWPRLCRWFGQRNQLSEENIQRLIKQRWIILILIALLEIVMVYGV